MNPLFLRKNFGFLGVSILVLSVMLCLVYEAKSQAGASASASAGWWSANGSVSPYFHDDPAVFPLGHVWQGSGTAYAGLGWSSGTTDAGSIYVKIVSLTMSSATVPSTGVSASVSTNIVRTKGRSASKTAPFKGKCASGKGNFAGNTIPGRYATWP